MNKLRWIALTGLLTQTGCAAIAVVDTAVGVTTTVVGTAIDVTGAAVGGAVDLVTSDDDEEKAGDD